MLLYDGEMVDVQSQEVWNILKGRLVTSEHAQTRCERFAFYNGRERWTGLECRVTGKVGSLFVVFGENRNSDDLVVMSWTYDWYQLNPPTLNDVPETAWNRRRYFKARQYEEAALLIENVIKLFANGEFR